eukprot:CAMPEP_0182474198 /NCGR_PEP_ID=MMETSP1319-20130603/25237_1 /TAXON_ID=172717 /ORGANISM="Bolidomonas pacifica, Strain RCC208" /LENGTH=110 /DNA_ID=CAMNT_0024675065 /DNA_START=134 /DNA_END=463 /DNA_ORIENTATION=-
MCFQLYSIMEESQHWVAALSIATPITSFSAIVSPSASERNAYDALPSPIGPARSSGFNLRATPTANTPGCTTLTSKNAASWCSAQFANADPFPVTLKFPTTTSGPCLAGS